VNLSTKIFLGYFILISCLLGGTFSIIRHQAETHEIARTEDALALIHLGFQERLESYQQGTLKLVQTITMDQKFRSFLSQIKDNYYPFAEEIALDTGADVVFMVDDSPQLGGIYPATDQSHTWIKQHLDAFRVVEVLDRGEASFHVLSLGHELFSVVYVPLKEALADDYAVGVMVVCKRMDDDWIHLLVGRKLKSFGIRTVFFTDGSPVAGNVPQEEAVTMVRSAEGHAVTTGSYVFAGERYIARNALFDDTGTGGSAGYILSSNLDQALRPFQDLQNTILLIGLVILVVGLFFSLALAKRMVKPLRLLVAGTREVAKGNYDVRVPRKSRDEIGELADAFNSMTEGLREKDRIRDTFSKYVHPSIVTQLLASPENLSLGGVRQVQSVLFSDLANFTRYSERMNPTVLLSLLNEFFEAMTEQVSYHQGVLDKYLGDGIMAFWGPPFTKGNHASQACKAAIGMKKNFGCLCSKWFAEGHPEIGMRIGVATGEMVVGNIGCERSRDFTCIGNTVNYGSRLEDLNKLYGTQILIDETTYKLAHRDIVVRELDTVQVRGQDTGSCVFELVGLEGEIPGEQKQVILNYQEGLAIYRRGDFELAGKTFAQINNGDVHDTPSDIMYRRCQYYIEHPPAQWSGTHIMGEK